MSLNLPEKTDEELHRETEPEKQQAIATAQDQLLAELAGSRYVVGTWPQNVPRILLSVGPEALEVLERSDLVLSVREAIFLYPSK